MMNASEVGKMAVEHPASVLVGIAAIFKLLGFDEAAALAFLGGFVIIGGFKTLGQN